MLSGLSCTVLWIYDKHTSLRAFSFLWDYLSIHPSLVYGLPGFKQPFSYWIFRENLSHILSLNLYPSLNSGTLGHINCLALFHSETQACFSLPLRGSENLWIFPKDLVPSALCYDPQTDPKGTLQSPLCVTPAMPYKYRRRSCFQASNPISPQLTTTQLDNSSARSLKRANPCAG